jgi:chromosome segregation ATPase
LRKAEHDRAVAVAHGEDCIKQIHELKSTVGRLEMRIRALEAEKGGIVLEKGGLAEQLATLDNDFRELQQRLADTRCLLSESNQRETYLKTLLDDLQVLSWLLLFFTFARQFVLSTSCGHCFSVS